MKHENANTRADIRKIDMKYFEILKIIEEKEAKYNDQYNELAA